MAMKKSFQTSGGTVLSTNWLQQQQQQNNNNNHNNNNRKEVKEKDYENEKQAPKVHQQQ